MTTVDELVGKRMQHLTFDSRDREKWFTGVVICQKSDSDNKLVICYDFDYKLHYKLHCFENFVVKLTPTDLLGNPIRKIFIKLEENDFWWKKEIIISQDLNSSPNVIVNFSLTMMIMMRVNPQ